jgi:hypothetical protein
MQKGEGYRRLGKQHRAKEATNRDNDLLREVPEVDECDLAEIGNSKEETRGTQFRQVRAARSVIPYILYAAWLWIDWVRLQDDAI